MHFLRGIILIHLLFLNISHTSQDRTFIGPTNIVSSINSTIELRCRLVGGGPDDRVAWFFKGLPVGRPDPAKDIQGYSQYPNRPRFRSFANPGTGEFRLKISQLSTDDAGTYQCQAVATQTMGHLNSIQANLTVQVPPTDLKMKIQTRGNFFETRPEYNLRSNMTITVRCEVSPSYPPPSVTWNIGQVALENMRNSVIIQRAEQPAGGKNVLTDSILTFVAEPWMDGKELKCSTSHPALHQNLEKSAHLSVLYIPFVNVTLVPDLPFHREFSSLLAECNVKAKPDHNRIRWYIGGRQVENASSSSLQIPSIHRQHHNQQIQCGAENSIGISYASVDVSVTYGPKFTTREIPEDVWVDPREVVTLNCDDVDSNPPATVRWFRRHDNDPRDISYDDVINGGGGGADDDGGGKMAGGDDDDAVGEGPTLTFRPSDSKAFGVYSCVASSPGFDDVTRSFFVGRKGRPLVIGPKEQTAVPGRIGSIFCLVRGIPRPDKIVWYKNGDLLDFDKEIRYSVKERDTRYGRLSTVEILDAIDSDFTIFNCSSSSTHGFDSQLIILRRRELVPFYCWVATAVAAAVLMMILIASIVCCKYWKNMPGSVVCCQKDKKLPSSDGSASTSQTSSDSMDLKRICNLPDISIQHAQNKNYLAAYNKQSPTFDTLEQKQKLLQVVDPVEKSYTRFESPNHHMYHNYHPNRPYPCDSPDCHSSLGMRHDDFITERYSSCGSGGARVYPHERETFISPYPPKSCMQEDCNTAFKAYAKLASGNLYAPTPVTNVVGVGVVGDEREEEYVDDIRSSQYNPNLCTLGPPLSLNRQYYQPPIHHPPLQYSPSSGGSVHPPRGQPPMHPQSASPYSSPSPTDSKLSTNV